MHHNHPEVIRILKEKEKEAEAALKGKKKKVYADWKELCSIGIDIENQKRLCDRNPDLITVRRSKNKNAEKVTCDKCRIWIGRGGMLLYIFVSSKSIEL